MVAALVVLAAVLAVTVTLLLRPEWLLTGLLVALEIIWLRVNSPVEGAVLWSFSHEHGLTVADLLVPATLPVAAWAAVRLRSANS